MINSNMKIQQYVALTNPDKQAEVLGPRGKETLLLDGMVDKFVADEASNFPMRDLEDLQALLKSKSFKELCAGPKVVPNWKFQSAPASPSSTTILSVKPTREGMEVSWGGQKVRIKPKGIRLKGEYVELESRIPMTSPCGSTVSHTIQAEQTPNGMVCLGESYSIESGYNGNLWQTLDEAL